MKVAMPVQVDNGMDSVLSGHFGSAPFFAVLDTESGELQVVENDEAMHEHGQCMPVDSLAELGVQAVLCNGMGRRAIMKFVDQNIRVLQAMGDEKISDILPKLRNQLYVDFSLQNACSGH